MSVEVEVKLKVHDKKQLGHRLKQQGFVTGKLVAETDIYYTAPHHDFARLDEALRIRTVKDLVSGKETAVITFKGPKLDQVSMTRQELETEVGNAKTARKILESIGFQPVLPVEKKRQYFYHENMTACIDSVKNLGNYLELEILTDLEENRTAALQKIEETLKQLGYSMQETTRSSYLSMLMKE